jgi:hypothetical protein
MKCSACNGDNLEPHAVFRDGGHVEGYFRCSACGNVQQPAPVADATPPAAEEAPQAEPQDAGEPVADATPPAEPAKPARKGK